MSENSPRILRFCLLTAGAVLLIFFAGFADTALQTGRRISLGTKLLFSAAELLFLFRRRREKLFVSGRITPGLLLLALLPGILTALRFICRSDRVPGAGEWIEAMLDALFTALWEESFFRGIGCEVFSKPGAEGADSGADSQASADPGAPGSYVLPLSRGMALSLIFALAHSGSLLSGDFLQGLLQMLLAFSLGLLFQGLYGRSGLFLPLLGHFLVNAVGEIGLLIMTDQVTSPLPEAVSVLIPLTEIAAAFLAGILLTARNSAVRNSAIPKREGNDL